VSRAGLAGARAVRADPEKWESVGRHRPKIPRTSRGGALNDRRALTERALTIEMVKP
jgi:hypothetical protein